MSLARRGIGALCVLLAVGGGVRLALLGGPDGRVVAAWALAAVGFMGLALHDPGRRSGWPAWLVALGAVLLQWAVVQHDVVWEAKGDPWRLPSRAGLVLEVLPDGVVIEVQGAPDTPVGRGLAQRLRRWTDAAPELAVRWQQGPVNDRGAPVVQWRLGDRVVPVGEAYSPDAALRARERLLDQPVQVLCLLQGQGEPTLGGEGGYLGLPLALSKMGVAVAPRPGLSLADAASCDGIAWVSPRTPMAPGFAAALTAYVRDGGRLLALADPGAVPSMGPALSGLGVDLVADPLRVSERSRQLAGFPQGEVFLVAAHQEAPGGPFAAGEVVLADAAGLQVNDDADGGRRVLRWAPTTPSQPVAAAGEWPGGGRLVVWGDADFASDGWSDLGANAFVVPHGVAWLLSGDHRVVAPEPQPAWTLTASRREALLALVWGGVPALWIAGGVVQWLRRRRREPVAPG